MYAYEEMRQRKFVDVDLRTEKCATKKCQNVRTRGYIAFRSDRFWCIDRGGTIGMGQRKNAFNVCKVWRAMINLIAIFISYSSFFFFFTHSPVGFRDIFSYRIFSWDIFFVSIFPSAFLRVAIFTICICYAKRNMVKKRHVQRPLVADPGVLTSYVLAERPDIWETNASYQNWRTK